MMRLEAINGDAYELWWDSQNRLRMWQGHSRHHHVTENQNSVIITSYTNCNSTRGHSLRFTYRYPDDPEYFDDEEDCTELIRRIIINGEEVTMP